MKSTVWQTLLEKQWFKTSDNQFLAIGRYSEGNWMGRINPRADDILTNTPSSFCAEDVYYQDGFPSAQVAAAHVLKMYENRTGINLSQEADNEDS